MNPKQKRFLARVVDELNQNRFVPSSPQELAETLVVPVQAVEAIIPMGIQDGQICAMNKELFYGKGQFDTIIDTLRERTPEDGYEPASFRSSTGLSRRLADGLFQMLLENGAVRREGARWFISK